MAFTASHTTQLRQPCRPLGPRLAIPRSRVMSMSTSPDHVPSSPVPNPSFLMLAAITAAAQEVNGQFCCGGEVQAQAKPPNQIKIATYDKAAVGKSPALLFTLPANERDIPDLLSQCQEASFGRGSESVLDPSYRSALCLSPTSFSTSFSLEQHGILSTIKTLIMPKANGAVIAELYKLNIYRPGDFFKSHVDTPRGSKMFGSLVVCLPQPHTGGQLKLQVPPARQQGKRKQQEKQPQQQEKQQQQEEQQQQQQPSGHEFDWGINSSKGTVQWAAFYSDCPHEILPVESGYRITLTYNLLLSPPQWEEPAALPGLCGSSMALHAVLKRALLDPNFMPLGGTLGFACQHAYPHTQEELCDAVPFLLKGADAALQAVAKSLRLSTEVKAVHDTKDDNYHDDDEDETPWRLSTLAPCQFSDVAEEDDCWTNTVSSLYEDSTGTAGITWCLLPSRWVLQTVGYAYGNDYTMQGWYSAAAILVYVPRAGRRGSYDY